MAHARRRRDVTEATTPVPFSHRLSDGHILAPCLSFPVSDQRDLLRGSWGSLQCTCNLCQKTLLQRLSSITPWIRLSPSKQPPPSFPTLPSSHHWNSFSPCPAACLTLLLHDQDIQNLTVIQEQSSVPPSSPHSLRDAEKTQSTDSSPVRPTHPSPPKLPSKGSLVQVLIQIPRQIKILCQIKGPTQP